MKRRLLLLFLSITIVSNAYGQRAIEFIENKGQWFGNFNYKATTPQGDIFLRKGGYTINLASNENHEKIHAYKHGEIKNAPRLYFHAYEVNFLGANPNHSFESSKPQKHYYNYFIGNKKENWKSNIYPSLTVDYKNLYQGIDAHIFSDAGKIKYDLLVAAGANTEQVQLEYNGIDGLYKKDENLILKTSLGEIQELKPYAYQIIEDSKNEVPCEYKIRGRIVSFNFPEGYDRDHDLVIDPVLVFSTFSGSTGDNWGTTATYDQFGNYYGGGTNRLTGFPFTTGAYDTTYIGGPTSVSGPAQQDGSILKFDATGTTLLYATYLGGNNNEQPHSLVVDTNTGNLIIVGRTASPDFPMQNAFDATHNGGYDLFVTILDPTGSNLIGSTFVGGSGDDGVNVNVEYTTYGSIKHNYGDDARSEVILDNTGNIYVSAMTSSTNFPTQSANQGNNGGGQDGVIFELNPTCSNLLWSTYWGGSLDDACYVLSFDKTSPNELYVAGGTASSNFPTTAGSLHPNTNGGTDGFISKFNATTKATIASSYIGTNAYDQVFGVQTDDSNNVYIMGQTQGAYPTTPGVYSNPNSPQFITKLDANLSNILISTVFGSGSTATTNISPTAFLVDRCGNIYVSGWGGPTGGNPGNTNGLPTTPTAIVPPMRSTTDGSDFYFFVVNNNMTNLVYGAYFGILSPTTPVFAGGEHVDGGTSRFDPNGVVYQAMCASCGVGAGFPTTTGTHAPIKPGGANCNLGAVKIDFQLQDPDADANAGGNTRGCAPHTVNFLNNSISASSYVWDFGDGSATSSMANPSHTYTTAGSFTARLIAINPNGCTVASDTDFIQITVIDDSLQAGFTFVKVDSCNPYTANFTNTTTFNNGPINPGTVFDWDFGDNTTFTGLTPPLHNFPAPQSYTITLTVTDTNACNNPDIFSQTIDFSTSVVLAGFNCPDSVCLPASINFIDASTNATNYAWTFGDGGTSNVSNPNHTYTAPGVYNIKLITANPASCNLLDSFTKTITVFGNPTADFSYTPNPPTPNTPLQFQNLSLGATSYEWDFGDGTVSDEENPTKIYNRNGFYTVCLRALNEFGCPDVLCKTVQGNVIPLVDVPTGFSPNGDGVNDILNVLGYGIETLRFQIYNRWGELVFETNDRYKGWDGTYKGEPQEMDAYGYLIDATFFDGSKKLKKGNVTLLR